MNKFNWFAIGLAIVFSAAVLAQDEKPEGDKQQEESQATPFEELKSEFNQIAEEAQTEQQKLVKEYREAKDDEERSAVITKLRKMQEPFDAKQAEIGLKIAKLLEAVESADESFEIIGWLLQNSRDDKVRTAAVAQLVEQHVGNEKILQLIPILQRGGASAATQTALEAIAEKGGTDSIKGAALISLAEYLFQFKSMYSDLLAESPEALEAMPESDAAYFKKVGAVSEEEIEGLLNEAIEKFADVEYKDSTIGQLAKKQLRSIEVQRNLAIGKEAPDIEGKDIDGVSFKLSDYRGKVVMLDFWGHW